MNRRRGDLPRRVEKGRPIYERNTDKTRWYARKAGAAWKLEPVTGGQALTVTPEELARNYKHRGCEIFVDGIKGEC